MNGMHKVLCHSVSIWTGNVSSKGMEGNACSVSDNDIGGLVDVACSWSVADDINRKIQDSNHQLPFWLI